MPQYVVVALCQREPETLIVFGPYDTRKHAEEAIAGSALAKRGNEVFKICILEEPIIP